MCQNVLQSQLDHWECDILEETKCSVSYTHLDVYKRQVDESVEKVTQSIRYVKRKLEDWMDLNEDPKYEAGLF